MGKLWQKHSPRPNAKRSVDETISPEAERKLGEYFNSFSNGETTPEVAQLPIEELDSLSVERHVPGRKGSWRLLPKKIVDAEDKKMGRG